MTGGRTRALSVLICAVLAVGLPPGAAADEHCESHPQISVVGDEGWQGFILGHDPMSGEPVYRPGSGVLSGTGTEEDPYLIAGWCVEVDARQGNRQNGIHLQDTSAHVVIRDNEVRPVQRPRTPLGQDTVGIRLQSVTNVVVSANLVEGHRGVGIHVTLSSDVLIEDNTVRGITNNGIILGASTTGTVLRGNDVSGNGADGIRMQGVQGNTIVGNIVYDNRLNGIRLGSSNGNVFRENVAHSNARSGIDIQFGSANEIRDNELHGNGWDGIRFAPATGNTIEGNDIHGNGLRGIVFGGSHENLIRNNTVRANAFTGVTIWSDSERNVVEGNTIRDHPWDGVALLNGDDNVVRWNAIRDNGRDGVRVFFAEVNELLDNKITDNSESGVRLGQAPGTTAHGNNLESNGVGLQETRSGPVDARENWWGCPDGPGHEACDPVVGDVMTAPWRTAPNPEAGPGSAGVSGVVDQLQSEPPPADAPGGLLLPSPDDSAAIPGPVLEEDGAGAPAYDRGSELLSGLEHDPGAPDGPDAAGVPHSVACDDPALAGTRDDCPLWAAEFDSGAPGPQIDLGDDVWAGTRDRRSRNEATAVATSPDGSLVFVTGLSTEPTSAFGMVTFAYDADSGEEVWRADRTSVTNSTSVPIDMAVDPAGERLYVLAFGFQGVDTGYEFLTVAYDPETGDELWHAPFHEPGSPEAVPLSLAVHPEGTYVYATGLNWQWEFSSKFATVAYHAATGEQAWAAFYQAPDAEFNDALDVAVDPAGERVYVTGQSWREDGAGADYATVAYDAVKGDELWATTSGGPDSQWHFPFAIAADPAADRVYVTGFSNRGATGEGYLTFAYDGATGEELWEARYDGAAGGNDRAYLIAVAPDGEQVYVSGFSPGGVLDEAGTVPVLSADYATVAYDTATGQQAWASRYAGPSGSDVPTGLGVHPAGDAVYVTGYSFGATPSCPQPGVVSFGPCREQATVSHDAVTGEQDWVARYASVSGVIPWGGLSVSPDGDRLYTTGLQLLEGAFLEEVSELDPQASVRYFTGYLTLAYDTAG